VTPFRRTIVAAGLEQGGIRTSCLGFGDEYNEDLLSDLARITNSRFYDASSSESFPAIFAAELEGLQKLSFQNLRLRIKPLDFCDCYWVLGECPSHSLPDKRIEFVLGDLVSGEERIVCFAVESMPVPCVAGIPAVSLKGEQLLEFEILFDELTADNAVSKTFTQVVRIQATQDPGQVRQNGEVISWVSVQRVGRLVREVTRHMDAGRSEDALKLLEAEDRWLSKQNADPDSDAARALSALRDRICSADWSARTRKAAYCQATAFSKMSSEDLWTGEGPAPKFKRPRRNEQRPEPPEVSTG